MDRETLYIPYGLKNRKEYFPGFGNSELLKTIIMFVIGGMIGALIDSSGENLFFTVILAIVFAGIAVAIFTQDPNRNICMVDQMKQLIRYIQSQKRFSFHRLDEMDMEGDILLCSDISAEVKKK